MAIVNPEVERYTLSSLFRFPKLYADISFFIKSEDYAGVKLHKTAFQVIADLIKKGEEVNVYSVSEKIKNLGIKFSETDDVFSYLEAVESIQISETGALQFFKDLAKVSMRREIANAGQKLVKEMEGLKDSTIQEILTSADKIYGSTLENFQKEAGQTFINIYENIERLTHQRIEDQKEKPIGFETPFKRVNQIFGPLFRSGGISMVAARTGVGKTSIGLYAMNSVAVKFKIPILHLDFGEMSSIEIRERAICQFCQGKVPLNLIENGQWRNNEETEKIVTKALKMMENYEYYYYDICDLSDDELFSLLRRFKLAHCSLLGGGENQFLTHLDYIKPREGNGFTKEYEVLGHFMKKLKNFFKNEAKAPLHTSLQLNKSGIVTGKNSNYVDESDGSFSLSDRINMQVSWSATLREMTLDELATYPECGNLMLVPNKFRFGGADIMDVRNPVEMPDGSFKKNRIFFESNNFCFKEIGCLKTLAPDLDKHAHPEDNGEKVDI